MIERFIKRLVDLIFSLTCLIILFPVILILTLVVKKWLGSPVIFSQNRAGINGETFLMFKFRTMTSEYDSTGNLLADELRLTRLGHLLRSTSLDELPTLWNVLNGDLSLVGPRPLLTEYVPLYNDEQSRRLSIKPGITGWAQINGRNAISWEQKFELDCWYVDNQSLWLDIKIILLTFKKVVIREGISAAGDATMPRFTGSSTPNHSAIRKS